MCGCASVYRRGIAFLYDLELHLGTVCTIQANRIVAVRGSVILNLEEEPSGFLWVEQMKALWIQQRLVGSVDEIGKLGHFLRRRARQDFESTTMAQ